MLGDSVRLRTQLRFWGGSAWPGEYDRRGRTHTQFRASPLPRRASRGSRFRSRAFSCAATLERCRSQGGEDESRNGARKKPLGIATVFFLLGGTRPDPGRAYTWVRTPGCCVSYSYIATNPSRMAGHLKHLAKRVDRLSGTHRLRTGAGRAHMAAIDLSPAGRVLVATGLSVMDHLDEQLRSHRRAADQLREAPARVYRHRSVVRGRPPHRGRDLGRARRLSTLFQLRPALPACGTATRDE